MPRLDLHVHTRRYSPCAEFLSPDELGSAMKRAELDGVVLTEHDAVWADAELEGLRRANPGCRFYSGVEVSAIDGHVIVIGVGEAAVRERGKTVDAIAQRVSELGGCAIWVHPFQEPRRWTVPARHCHAIEIYSTVTFGGRSLECARLAQALGIHTVAGSDAHAIDRVGAAGIELPTLPDDERALAKLVQSGRATPFWRE